MEAGVAGGFVVGVHAVDGPADDVADGDDVMEFLFDKGILGEGAPSADFVGVEYPDGTISGSEANVMFRFDASYMQMAADGEL